MIPRSTALAGNVPDSKPCQAPTESRTDLRFSARAKSFPLPIGTTSTGSCRRTSAGKWRWIVPSPPKMRTASASADDAGTPSIHSVEEPVLNGLRSFDEALRPKMTAARMKAGLRSQVSGFGSDSLADSAVGDLTCDCYLYFGRHLSMKSTRS